MIYLQDKTFLKQLDNLTSKEIFTKIVVLDIREQPVRQIQGRVTGGGISIDGNSSVRRSGSLVFLPEEGEGNLTSLKNIISIDKKVQIELGYANTTNKYTNYPIIWFPIGIYYITDVSMNKTTTGISISLQIQDKMAGLNGVCGGTFQAAVTLHKKADFIANIVGTARYNGQGLVQLEEPLTTTIGETFIISGNSDPTFNGSWQVQEGSTINYIYLDMPGLEDRGIIWNTAEPQGVITQIGEKIKIYDILREVMNHFGKEDLSNIIIENVPAKAREVLKWVGETPLNLYKNWDGTYQYRLTKAAGMTLVQSFTPGQNIGYRETDFVLTDELIAEAGQSITDVLDKIRNTLGNYEYFYDLDGKFIFREIKNYLNTSLATNIIETIQQDNYFTKAGVLEENMYDFHNGNLITSFSNTPQYSMIKNDFVAWGVQEIDGRTYPIRYHLAIDKKPKPLDSKNGIWEDWRNVLYRQGINAESLALVSNPYFLELKNEWPKLYNLDTYKWKEDILKNPSLAEYFLDFVDNDFLLNELGIEKIGRRTKVIKDKDINCIFAPPIPEYTIIVTGHTLPHEIEEEEAQLAEAIARGKRYATIDVSLLPFLALGTKYKDAFSVVRDNLYVHTNYNTAITIQALPIYYLDVNNRIGVHDDESGIFGDYIVNSINLPLSISETMTINATAALERI